MGAGEGAAQQIVGHASVIDGDTIEIRGERIRLEGIDAFESSQLCKNAQGKLYRCGQAAALALDKWIAARPVTCTHTGRDRYDRVLARCTVSGADVGTWL